MSLISNDDQKNKDKHFFGAWPREIQLSEDNNKKDMCNTDDNSNVEICNRNLNQYHYNRAMRSRFQRVTSLELIPEYPLQEPATNVNRFNTGTLCRRKIRGTENTSNVLSRGVRRMIFFIPSLLLQLILSIIRYILYIPLSIAAPSFWLSALLWILWKILRVPINLFRCFTSSGERNGTPSISTSSSNKKKRTILISCGSTIQTLHLARNFYSSGTRVVVFEFEGLFGLARFSQAVDKFYVVPRPTVNNPNSYINALCHIVRKEQPSVYIPVCGTSPAYYDALAKPHLELLGCASFIPGIQETLVLDDCMKFFQKCSSYDIPLPPHSILHSLEDLQHLYTNGFVSNFRNILIAAGMQGLLERYKYILPNNNRELKFNHDVSEQNPWLLVRDLPGDHYITCTTVKDSRVVANVTCKVEYGTQNLIPIASVDPRRRSWKGFSNEKAEEEEVENWIRTFFAKVRFQRNINGHISFRLVRCQSNKQLLPLGIRLGVSLPYICYNRSHAQILCRTIKCVHMMQLSLSQEEESVLALLSASWKWSSSSENNNTTTVALDKREALFVYWDPLPYCAFYHFQLPLESVKAFLQNRNRQSKNKAAAPAHIALPVH